MGGRSCKDRRANQVALLYALVLLAGLGVAAPAQAQGGLAISGSFSRQAFEIPQGSSVSGPSIYMVIFNNGTEKFDVRMASQAPLGVNIVLSDEDFALEAGEQRKILIGVEVTRDAAPGEYKISISAETHKEGVTGIQILGAAEQTARLVVVGESARVAAQMVDTEGQPVPGMVRLFKTIAGQSYEVAYSEIGAVEAIVAPGSYTVAAYVGGEKLAEESFQVAAGEEKTVTLVVRTVYFQGFGLVPNYLTETGQLSFAQVVYTVKNLYRQVNRAEVILRVRFNGTPLDEVLLAALTPLEIGQIGLSYNYIPADGWNAGSYGFGLGLHLDGKLYVATPEELLSVGEQPAAPASEEPAAINWGLIAGLAVAVVAVLSPALLW